MHFQVVMLFSYMCTWVFLQGRGQINHASSLSVIIHKAKIICILNSSPGIQKKKKKDGTTLTMLNSIIIRITPRLLSNVNTLEHFWLGLLSANKMKAQLKGSAG